VETTPDAIAVVFEDEQISYRELNRRANQLAHYLRSVGVKPDVPVGICMERSLEMIIGILGVLKAGGAYVPLDPEYPEERLTFILEDSQMFLLLTQEKILDRLSEHKAQIICLNQEWNVISQEIEENVFTEVQSGNLFYIVYTSGSTGKPKGVPIEHKNIASLFYWAQTIFNNNQVNGVLASTSICFDLSIFELFFPLIFGGKLILVENALKLSNLIECNNVNLVNTVPSAIVELVNGGSIPASVQTINLAGEPLHNTLVQQIYQQTTVENVFNLYGPSETTTYSTFARMIRGSNDAVSIGHPISNTKIYTLDKSLQLASIGVPAELYIGGKGLSRGYHNRPELTAEKFIPNPFSRKEGQRLYRTGDSARYLSDGNIEFIGRKDNQVKIRGYRIELGEIEAKLGEVEGIKEAVVLAREDQPGDKRLVAYVVSSQGQTTDVSYIRSCLKEKLPNYMIPSAFVMLDRMPLTPNGKVDRKSLPAPYRSGLEKEYIAPRHEVEKILVEIWSEVLGIERIGIYDNFFEIGGNSLLAIQIISRITSFFSIDLPLKILFEFPCIKDLCQQINEIHNNSPQTYISKFVHCSDYDNLPLSFTQERIWMLCQFHGSSYFNTPLILKMNGDLKPAILKSCFKEIIKRHEILRTNYITDEGLPKPIINRDLDYQFIVINLSNITDKLREEELKRLYTIEVQRSFDLEKDKMMRIMLIKLRDNIIESQFEYILCVNIHHIAFDGYSLDILVKEVSYIYSSLLMGKNSNLSDLNLQYSDFAIWQRNFIKTEFYKAGLAYWKSQLNDLPELLDLPLDYCRPAVQTSNGNSITYLIKQELSKKIQNLNVKYCSSMFITLLSVFSILLARYSMQHDIVIGTNIANRNHHEIESLIGAFINTLAFRLKLYKDQFFSDYLGQVKDIVLKGIQYQDISFENILKSLKHNKNLNHYPVFQAMLLWDDFNIRGIELPGLIISPFNSPYKNDTALKSDLILSASFEKNQLRLLLNYNCDLFKKNTMKRMLDNYVFLLDKIVSDPEQKINELILISQ
jgi:amino acid adenylation domain-containing protein